MRDRTTSLDPTAEPTTTFGSQWSVTVSHESLLGSVGALSSSTLPRRLFSTGDPRPLNNVRGQYT